MLDIGQLSEERIQILHALKFQFNPPRLVMNREWMNNLDAFTDWMSRNIEQNRVVDAAGLRWFEIGGWPAARLAVWAILQRELRSKGVLPNDAIQRLDEAKFEWTVNPGSRQLKDWLSSFGKLVAAVHNNVFSRSKRCIEQRYYLVCYTCVFQQRVVFHRRRHDLQHVTGCYVRQKDGRRSLE